MKKRENVMLKNEKNYIVIGNNHTIHESTIFNSSNIDDVWIVSDTHFNHYPKTWEWPARDRGWEKEIISKWNKTIGQNDTVLHLGDFAFGNKEMVMSTRAKLTGNIWMIKGNHDKHGNKWYKDVGVYQIKKSFFIDYHGLPIIFSHRPVKDLADEYLNIHGHIHEKFYFISKKYVNVSVEQTGFAPVKFKDLISDWRLHNERYEI